MTTLSTAYVAAVVRHIPEGSRDEIAEDVSSMITEVVEARLTTPSPDRETAAEAERAVLEELGDPAHLARQYTQAPQHLIGPQFYPLYLRALQWLLPIAGTMALLTNGIVYSLAEPEPRIGALIGAASGNTVIAVLIAFAAVTIGLALLERVLPAADVRRLPDGRRTWTVDQLQEIPPGKTPVHAESLLGCTPNHSSHWSCLRSSRWYRWYPPPCSTSAI